MTTPEEPRSVPEEYATEYQVAIDATILRNLYYLAQSQVPGSRQEDICADDVDEENAYQSKFNEDGTPKWHAENDLYDDGTNGNTRVYRKKRRRK